MFYFPRLNRELWANSHALKQTSSRFVTMLQAGSDGPATGAQPIGPSKSAIEAELDPTGDSDTETDQVARGLTTTRTRPTLPTGVREIVIASWAYTTFHATLGWLNSGFIEFAPISSAATQPGPTSTQPPAKRARPSSADIAKPADPTLPALPAPASPKSVYKLARFLELPALAGFALEAFRSQLTSTNVLYQIVSDIAVHDDVREAVTAFAQAHWPSVKNSAAAFKLSTVEAQKMIGVEATARLVELMRRC